MHEGGNDLEREGERGNKETFYRRTQRNKKDEYIQSTGKERDSENITEG